MSDTLELSGYILSDIEAGDIIKLSNGLEHQKPTMISWIKTGTNQSNNILLSNFKKYLDKHDIICNKYHDKYKCDFGRIEIFNGYGYVYMLATGICEQIID